MVRHPGPRLHALMAADAERGQLWHGRFESGPAEELVAFTESLSYDQRLIFDDIRCSKAHVRGLARAGLLREDELAGVLGALDTVEMEYRAGQLDFVASDEDVHTAIERRVTELAGDAGAKLHTGRSRNDQVATAFRSYVKRELGVIAGRVLDLVDVLASRADEAGTGDDAVYLPGYTHLQQAQPVLLAHHLMAHGWALLRDVDRLWDARRRLDVSPLGAGALAGSSLPLDPEATAAELGFDRAAANSIDAVSDRDFAAEF
ncbi:MAG: lyase family protein, partial [Microthrixaceae bacterium]